MNRIVRIMAGLGFAAVSALAHAQYPARPISMVVPFPPGGTSDSLARILADSVSKSLGVPVVVENKPGAEGQLAAQDVSKATPDGYRIGLVTSGNLSALPPLRRVPPYDPVKDFTPIVDVGRYAFFLYVHPTVPVKSFKEFVAYAKANPGKISYGTGNNTGVLAMAQFKSMFGLDMNHVPYKGEPPATLDLVANRVQAMVGTGAGLNLVKDGKLRALVALIPERSPLAPDVPVMRELDMGEFPVELWAAIVGPAGLPKDVVETLNKAFVAALNQDSVKKQIEGWGFAVTPSTPEQLAQLIRVQAGAYKKLIEDIGMQPLQ